MRQTSTVPLFIRVPVDLRLRLGRAAVRNGHTMSSMGRMLLERGVDDIESGRLRYQIEPTPPAAA